MQHLSSPETGTQKEIQLFHSRTNFLPNWFTTGIPEPVYRADFQARRRFQGAYVEQIPEPLSSLFKDAIGFTTKSKHRAVPSGGGFYPYEFYLATHQGVWHYEPDRHQLTKCSRVSLSDTREIQMLVTSIPYKSFKKYRDRCFRFSQIDIGHALCEFITNAQKLNIQITGFSEQISQDIRPFFDSLNSAGEYLAVQCKIQLSEPLDLEGLVSHTSSDSHLKSTDHSFRFLPSRNFSSVSSIFSKTFSPSTLDISHGRLESTQTYLENRSSADGFSHEVPLGEEVLKEFIKSIRLQAKHWARFFSLSEKNIQLCFLASRGSDLKPGLYSEDLNPVRHLDQSSIDSLVALPIYKQMAFMVLIHFRTNTLFLDLENYKRSHWLAGALGQAIDRTAFAMNLKTRGFGGFSDTEISSLCFGQNQLDWTYLISYAVGRCKN